ncbi:Radical SAM protein [Rhodovastum atsumiense]|uniref:Radical SAM protein n=1 Tax=Rhodovastum atsumiense TaxID=504468 RepID=A0A5M6IUN7_9PROT|nr:radical SAM protein [Rhodovastum atsumiense]KAA5611972.1 radical SAM protein [Rhodovastum atsumiense]CAH2598751.1 Radical SAM protein [Rhodovastum atsumiense]
MNIATVPPLVPDRSQRTPDDAARRALLQELQLKIALAVEGISFVPEDLRQFPIGTEYAEQIHLLFDMDRHHHGDVELPANFYLPHGLFAQFRWDPESRFQLRAEDGKPVLYRDGERLVDIAFYRRPDLLRLHTSDGESFEHIAAFTPEGGIQVCYSNECDLKLSGDDCKYCNINSTADAYRHDRIFLKTPQQVAEVYAAAHARGLANHINITGGFIPERREVDYYLDVADEIRARTGVAEIHGTAVIGAPLDLRVIERYREAGYTTIAMNLEIWNRDIFRAICPGKEKRCGGWEHWVKALETAAEVFGRGNVRSNIVAGIEPKDSILQGVEYLAAHGVLCYAGAWCPNPGSALEGHRSPEPAWHYDLTLKAATIFHRHGYKTAQLYGGLGASTPFHDAFRILGGENEGDHLPQYRHRQVS